MLTAPGKYAIIRFMTYSENFFSNMTSVVRLDPDAEIPDYENGIVFSCGWNTPSIVVTVADTETYQSFLSAEPEVRAEIIQEIYRKYA